MAKTIRNPINIKDVVNVHKLYNMAWRKHVKFPTTGEDWEHENRLSDYDLWNQDEPALTQKGTIGDGFTELLFTFLNTSENSAQDYVINFIKQNHLPYTYFEVKPSRDLRGLMVYGPDEEIPKYTRVIIRFEEDEVFNKRARER